MVFPGIEKMPIRNAFPYFKSFLSCSEGIVSVDFVLRDLTPVMRIHYVKSMWDDAKLWKEVFQTEKWTLRMADGTFKEADPRLKFTTEGKTVEAVKGVKEPLKQGQQEATPTQKKNYRSSKKSNSKGVKV